ncbi:MAG TPA: hypothetical protein VJT78_05105 [Candidatus Dormibacteraeota bacterium]|nr:hypothetical protein [Candidatus Dormibacteraeota bacterium]
MSRIRLALLASVAIVLGGCGTSGTPAAAVVHSPSTAQSSPGGAGPTPALTPSASFDLLPVRPGDGPGDTSVITCKGSIGLNDPVAVVQLHAGAAIVLRDYADVNHPRSVCTFQATTVLELLDATHVVIGSIRPGVYAVVDLPSAVYHWFVLPDASAQLLAVSVDLNRVAWLTSDQANKVDLIHLTTTYASDRVVASLPNAHQLQNTCTQGVSRTAAYADAGPGTGGYFFVLDQPSAPGLNSLLVMNDSQTLFKLTPPSSDREQPAMAFWWKSAVNYLLGGNRFALDVTAPSSTPHQEGLPDWNHPTVSADGRHVAYELLGADGSNDVYVDSFDQGLTNPTLATAKRTHPVFLNSTQLWYRVDESHTCDHSAGTPLIYDIGNRTEYSTIIDRVYAVWPATSAEV